MSRHFTTLGLACVFLMGAPAVQAGSVDVVFDADARFSDAGATPAQRKQQLDTLAAHLRKLGERRLGADRSLRVEVIDLDLAGNLEPGRRLSGDVRVIRGRSDGPRIELSYTLSQADRVLSSGRETLTDVGFPAPGTVTEGSRDDPLRHEKRLLERWFEARFGKAASEAR